MPDLQALSRGTLIILVAGVLLFIDSFLAWQKVSVEILGTTISETKMLWDSAAGLLAGLALLALLVWIVLRAANVNFMPKVSTDRLVIGVLAGVVFVLVLLKNLIDDYSAWPSYVGVLLAAGVLAGAWLHLREEPAAEAAPEATPETAPTPVEPT
jgi:hypothetical protein